MTKTKGKTKNTKSEKTKRESGEMSPAKKLFRQYYPFYKYTPNGIKRLDKREVLAFGKIDTRFFLLVVILLIMTAYPLIFTFFYSFTNYNLLRNLRSPAKITVFQNYVKLLKDPYFQQSIWNLSLIHI